MILLMNIIIAVVGYVGILTARKLSRQGEKLGMKNHFIILGIKVLSIVIIISLFCFSSENNTHVLIILTGLLNLIVFHFIEAFVTQKILINNRNLNV